MVLVGIFEKNFTYGYYFNTLYKRRINMKKIDSFPAADGHIESILMGAWQMKISFHTWNGRKLVIIFNDVRSVISLESVYYDIGEFCIVEIENKQF